MQVPEYRPPSLLLRPSRRYVVTQATDNSVPFYERMGFVRVGAVSAAAKQRGGKGGAEDDGELTPGGGKKRKAAEPVVSSEVSVPVITHVTVEAAECCASVAAAYNVDVFDVVFLNRAPRSEP
jgi:hypothetical protein